MKENVMIGIRKKKQKIIIIIIKEERDEKTVKKRRGVETFTQFRESVGKGWLSCQEPEWLSRCPILMASNRFEPNGMANV